MGECPTAGATKTVKVQSQCARVTLSGELVYICHMIGSSGLNLAYEVLLLGMRDMACREFLDEAPSPSIGLCL
jgi:hypothetical protein